MMQYHHHVLCICVLAVVISAVRSVPHAYHLITTQRTWADAKAYCRTTYTDLAVVVSDRDWLKIQREAESKSLSSSAWVGLFDDISSWRWSYKNVILALKYWFPGQPDNSGGHQSCGSIDPLGLWWDDVCTTKMPFLCYNAKYHDSDKYIWISTPAMTWFDAQTYCRANYTDLASVNSAADNNLAQATVKLRSWFGLFRDSWKWVDGTNASSVSWMKGHPNNYWGNEYCGYLHPSDQYAEAGCQVQFAFFCHSSSPASEKQIIQVNVKTDENTHDPQVQSAILEMMQLKLEHLGMLDNTTLSWREQQDGNIFHKKKEEIEEVVDDSTQTVCRS